MSEPRRWTLHADNMWEPANDPAHESYVEEGTQVIEAAPVEAELERLRKIETAARLVVTYLAFQTGPLTESEASLRQALEVDHAE